MPDDLQRYCEADRLRIINRMNDAMIEAEALRQYVIICSSHLTLNRNDLRSAVAACKQLMRDISALVELDDNMEDG